MCREAFEDNEIYVGPFYGKKRVGARQRGDAVGTGGVQGSEGCCCLLRLHKAVLRAKIVAVAERIQQAEGWIHSRVVEARVGAEISPAEIHCAHRNAAPYREKQQGGDNEGKCSRSYRSLLRLLPAAEGGGGGKVNAECQRTYGRHTEGKLPPRY